jgi:hypothetical protein
MDDFKYPTQEDVMAALLARMTNVAGSHGAQALSSGEGKGPVFCVHWL